MLTLCRTLMGADLIIIDEPTEGWPQDCGTGGRRVPADAQAKGISVLLIEQKLTIAMTISDRCLVMGQQHRFDGTPDSLRADN